MNKDKLEPRFDFIDSEIETIVQRGVKPRVSFLGHIKDMYSQLGVRNIFHDMSEIIFIVLIGIVFFTLALVVTINDNSVTIQQIYSFIFVVSPLLYLSISLFSFFNTIQKKTFEIEMTCKYNIYQISALRMLIFSIVSILINTIILFIFFYSSKEIDVLRVLIISISSLFLFSSIFLYAIVNISASLTKYFITLGWISANIILNTYKIDFYNKLLMEVPMFVHILITMICTAVYLKNLKRLINFKNIKGEI